MDWVEARAKNEKILSSRSRQFWNAFRLTCDVAVKSHYRCYRMQFAVSFSAVGENTFLITVDDDGDFSEHRVTFDPAECVIKINARAHPIEISDDGNLLVMHEQKPLSAEAFSKALLEPILFPRIAGRSVARLTELA